MTAHRIGFLIWPSTKALTLALAEEALRVAQRVHPDVTYELSFLQAESPTEGGAWQLPGEPWAGRLEGCQKLFLLADEPPAPMSSLLSSALKQLVRSGCQIGGLSAGIYPLAQLGLLDGYRAAVHWR
jgi:transcriptional regulator GlxA family with amidase domain